MCHPTGDAYRNMLSDFPSVFKPEFRHTNPGAASKHRVYHDIKTTGHPVHSCFRRLKPEKLHAAKLAFAEIEHMGICSKAASPWASSLHMVWTTRGAHAAITGDSTAAEITELDYYPMPKHHRLDSQHKYKFTQITPPRWLSLQPFGSYVFHYSTFGLRDSGATFKRIFGELQFCMVYTDDIHTSSMSTQSFTFWRRMA
ncbi:uncharacterized protein LOC119576692 [Penaeus monodon]|uniref:uncharacterized protein LOC119576692 n=1 Tax=Penaeus monodon TaxID=6687 RepID=UPI0018A77590|nr:uncharacterized protein LOC119576692 [Penaeus monodon]